MLWKDAELLNAMQYSREITELLGTKDVNATYLKYAQYRKNIRPRISFMPLGW